MTNEEIIREIRKLADKHKYDSILTFGINYHMAFTDIANHIVEQEKENDKLKAEIKQLKEDYSVLARQYDNVENSSIRYYNEVKQLKSELEQSIRLPLTNADKIRSMSDEELAEFLSENTNCDCCNIQCVDKLNCPSMSSCLFRFMEWLKSEVEK